MLSLQDLDQVIFTFINRSSANPFFDVLFPAITDLHKTIGFKFVFIPALLMLMIFLYRMRGLLMSLGLALSLGAADRLGSTAKNFWLRPRPFDNPALDVIQRSGAGHFSFPSNHAANMFCMAFFLLTFFPKLRWVFFTIAILVSLSRIYNGVHYPSDVVAGAILGSLTGFFGGEVTKKVIEWYENFKVGKEKNV